MLVTWYYIITVFDSLGIFKLLNKAQPLDVPALQKVIMKLDSGVHEVCTCTT